MKYFGDFKNDSYKKSYVKGYEVEDDILIVKYLAQGDTGFPYSENLENEIVKILEDQYKQGLERYKTIEIDSIKNLELFIGTFISFIASVTTYVFVKNPFVLFFMMLSILVSMLSFIRFRALSEAVLDLDKYKTYFENTELFRSKIDLIDETKLHKKLRKYVERKREKEEFNINDVNNLSMNDLMYILSSEDKPLTRTRNKDNE